MPGGKARFVVQSIGLCVLRRGPRAELQGEFAPVPLKQADFTAKMANVKCPQASVLGRANRTLSRVCRLLKFHVRLNHCGSAS